MCATPENLRNNHIMLRMQEKLINNIESAVKGEYELIAEPNRLKKKKKPKSEDSADI